MAVNLHASLTISTGYESYFQGFINGALQYFEITVENPDLAIGQIKLLWMASCLEYSLTFDNFLKFR